MIMVGVDLVPTINFYSFFWYLWWCLEILWCVSERGTRLIGVLAGLLLGIS